jgi:hypothetical protein
MTNREQLAARLRDYVEATAAYGTFAEILAACAMLAAMREAFTNPDEIEAERNARLAEHLLIL